MSDNNIPTLLRGNSLKTSSEVLDDSFNNKEFSAYILKINSTKDSPTFHKALAYLFETVMENPELKSITQYLEKREHIGKAIIYELVEALQIHRSPYFGEMFGEGASRDLSRSFLNKEGNPRLLKTLAEVKKILPNGIKGSAVQLWNWLANKSPAGDAKFTGHKKIAVKINVKMQREILLSFKEIVEKIENIMNADHNLSRHLGDRNLLIERNNRFRIKYLTIAKILNWRFNLDDAYKAHSDPNLIGQTEFQPKEFFTAYSVEKEFNPQKPRS